jgi:hypothetical protein
MVSEKIRVAPICRKQAARSQAKACDGLSRVVAGSQKPMAGKT